jgi:hypothetical protein
VAQHAKHYGIPAAVPVALNRDPRGEGAFVVVRGVEGIAHGAYARQRPAKGEAEGKQGSGGMPTLAAPVIKWGLPYSTALTMNMGEEFDQEVEALRMKLERFEGFVVAEPNATGHILNWNSKDGTHHSIQEAVEQLSPQGHIGMTAGDIA